MKKILMTSVLLAAAACHPLSTVDGGGGAESSGLASVSISGGKLDSNYKMQGDFSLSVATDGSWIKDASGQMIQSLSASLQEGSPLNLTLTKGKSYKFLLTGKIMQSNTGILKNVKTCEKNAAPILITQNNQAVGIALCDDNQNVVSSITETTNVTIETTYTPEESSGGDADLARLYRQRGCKCPEANEYLRIKNESKVTYVLADSLLKNMTKSMLLRDDNQCIATIAGGAREIKNSYGKFSSPGLEEFSKLLASFITASCGGVNIMP